MNKEYEFNAFDYTYEDKFIKSNYKIIQINNSWEILRNNKPYLTLGNGYMILKTKLCGICSTDIARRFLPFSLPQVIGHEILAEDLEGINNYAIEISDSCFLRGDNILDIFCSSNLRQHCPDHFIIGINSLLGGFSPYIVVPLKAAIKVNKTVISDYSAVLIEPFAAALNAIFTSPPQDGESLCVVGPKKLGGFILAGLKAYKKFMKIEFNVTAVVRNTKLYDFAIKMGANEVIESKSFENSQGSLYDVVYDTSGSEDGLKLALKLSKRELHLKSTNGQMMCGLNNLYAMVVDEIAILPFNRINLDYVWREEKRQNRIILCSNTVLLEDNLGSGYIVKKVNLKEIDEKFFNDQTFCNRLPRFDIGIAGCLEDIDLILRPVNSNSSLVRPRGVILYKGNDNENEILKFLSNGGKIKSSRCGDFNLAIKFLEEFNFLSKLFEENVISKVFDVESIQEAFNCAKESDVVKVIIKH